MRRLLTLSKNISVKERLSPAPLPPNNSPVEMLTIKKRVADQRTVRAYYPKIGSSEQAAHIRIDQGKYGKILACT